MTIKTPNNNEQVYVYRIDENNNIIYVSDNWSKFAKDNDASDSCIPPFVFGKSLFDFISDKESRHLYSIIIETVRDKNRSVRIPIRCDSPQLRRFMEITVKALPGNQVEFSSKVIRLEPRDNLRILNETADRSEEIVRICSYCKKIAISDEEWIDAEKAIELLDLFKSVKLPQLTHGVCPVCYESVMANLK
jgi:hypothetical protein